MLLETYSVLGLKPNADDVAIRARYLELVRQFPPEREPRKAAEIRAAYDALRDPVARLKRHLFDIEHPITLEGLVKEQTTLALGRRLPTDVLLSLGKP